MEQEYWKKLEKVNNYLNSKQQDGIHRFKELIKRLDSELVATCVVIFTHEYLEAYGKGSDNSEFKFYDCLSDTINHYDIDEMINCDYQEGLCN